MLFITSADATAPIKVISYKALGDASKSARAFKKELETANVLGESKPAEEDKTTSKKSNALLAEKQNWTNSQGKQITAAIKSATDLNVVFVMKYNKLVTYPMGKLSADSQAKIKALLEKDKVSQD